MLQQLRRVGRLSLAQLDRYAADAALRGAACSNSGREAAFAQLAAAGGSWQPAGAAQLCCDNGSCLQWATAPPRPEPTAMRCLHTSAWQCHSQPELAQEPGSEPSSSEGGHASGSAPASSSSSATQQDPFLEDTASIQEGPIAAYRDGRQSGLYRPDKRQENTILMLQTLFERLKQLHVKHRRPSGLTLTDHVGESNQKHRWWERFVHGGGHQPAGEALLGLYMWGGVGVGKTMLMDLLVKAARPEFKLLRAHFHDFMLSVHSRLKKAGSHRDPLVHVADEISRETKVLCLDEFFVTDVADAAILNRLFGRLWDNGLVLVATTNRRPDALYEGGLQRDLFLPFIAKLQKMCVVHDMASATDYRRLAQHHRGLYFTDGDADEHLEERFREVTGQAGAQPETVQVMMGRRVEVPAAGAHACMFGFADLCGRNVAAADFIALADRFHTMALRGVPVFTAATRSEAYRFVTLVDVLYEHRVRLFCSAAAKPTELFANILTQADAGRQKGSMDQQQEEALVVDDNLGFSKERIISRLTEMQSLEYLQAHAKQHEPALLPALTEQRSRPAVARRN